MKTLKFIAKSLARSAIRMFQWICRNNQTIRTGTFAFLAIFLCIHCSDAESAIAAIAASFAHLFLLLIEAWNLRKAEEDFERFSKTKRLTFKDPAGNYAVKREDLDKAIIMLGEIEDAMKKE